MVVCKMMKLSGYFNYIFPWVICIQKKKQTNKHNKKAKKKKTASLKTPLFAQCWSFFVKQQHHDAITLRGVLGTWDELLGPVFFLLGHTMKAKIDPLAVTHFKMTTSTHVGCFPC